MSAGTGSLTDLTAERIKGLRERAVRRLGFDTYDLTRDLLTIIDIALAERSLPDARSLEGGETQAADYPYRLITVQVGGVASCTCRSYSEAELMLGRIAQQGGEIVSFSIVPNDRSAS